MAAIGDGVKPAVGAYAQSGNAAELRMSRAEFESAQQYQPTEFRPLVLLRLDLKLAQLNQTGGRRHTARAE